MTFSRSSHDRHAAVLALAVVHLLAIPATSAHAQDTPDERPAFSLASDAAGSSRHRPAVLLTFRRLDHLDFRVYRVTDAIAFMARLEDPHQLGSEEPLVDQEPTRLERIANWKAARRGELRDFLRAQFSYAYRVERRRRADTRQVALRRTLRVTTFAQVPLLNASQLVTSWRELLPPVRDAEVRRVPLDLAEAGLYVVEAVHAPLKAYTIVIVTDVGVVSKAAPGQVLLFAANRFTGEPVAGCAVQVLGDRVALADGTTGADGTFTARVPEATAEDVIAVTRCGQQVAATDPGGWYVRVKTRDLVGYVYTDKPIYRPGHAMHLKAVLRWRSQGALLPFDRPAVELRVTDPTDKVVYRETRQVDAFGAVDTTWNIPPGAALGYYAVQVASEDDEASGSFEVQEYRKPEYEVRVTPAERFAVQGGGVRLAVDARYYFGQPVARGLVRYVVRRQPYYSPLRWDDDSDGTEGGWWYAGDETTAGEVRLSDAGKATIDLPTEPDENRRDYSLRIDARVTDAGGREVSGTAIVHLGYGPFMVIATQDEYVKRPGADVTLSVRTVDYHGEPTAGARVRVSLERRIPGKRWDETEGHTVASEGALVTDDTGRGTWVTKVPGQPGDYRLRAAADADGRLLQDEAHIWVAGPADASDGGQEFDRYLELIADKRSYAPGDTARVLVRGEEFEAPVLVTKEDQDVSWHAVVRARANTAIEVPITEDDIGDTWVNVVFLRNDRLFRAERRLTVPATSRQLQLAIVPTQPVSKPRLPATYRITATDPAGAPVRAQVSVAVIDEAVYGVKPDQTPDPLRFFYKREYSRVGTQFSRHYSFVGYSGTRELTLAGRRRSHGLADFKGERARPQVRKEFPDAIFWVPDLVTREDGTAEVTLTYPDALTTWRVTARAVTTDTRVGAAVARTTTTKDLIVRAVTPRFLSQGDTVVVPVITHNYLPGSQRVTVSLAADGLTSAATPAGPPPGERVVEVPTGGEQRLDWSFRADRVGPVSITARAVAASDGDAVQMTLPVLPFGVKTQTSLSGSLLGTATRSVSLDVPAATNPAARTVDVTLAPSMAGSLLGALDFLTGYPYGCTEQILSSFLPNLVVTRTLSQLGLAPTERLKALDRQVTAGLERLLDQQHEDGGWGWWETDENHPFMTAYALFGLVEARANGYKVDESKIRQGAEALAGLYAKYPRAVPALKAYMAFVLVRTASAVPEARDPQGFVTGPAVNELWSARGDLTAYGRALLLQTLDLLKDARGDTLARELLAEVTRTGDLASWRVERDPLLDDWADTSVEATAMAVQALVGRDAQHPVLEAAVRYLLVSRSAGSYWGTTKQTAMVLYGLLDYMRARKETPRPFTVDVTVNGAPAGSAAITAASITAAEPMRLSAPAVAGANAVAIVKRGEGALYWSATATYFDTRTPITRTGSRQLAIVRRYFSLSPVVVKGRTVYREAPFAGIATPGDVLLVRVSVAGSPDWRYLMVEDPLPAGTEPIADDGLYALEKGASRDHWWTGRREFRDDRAVFFRDSLRDGRMDLQYLLKVTTPGAFTAMPARVTPMYVPGVSASSDVQPVTVHADGGAQ